MQNEINFYQEMAFRAPITRILQRYSSPLLFQSYLTSTLKSRKNVSILILFVKFILYRTSLEKKPISIISKKITFVFDQERLLWI